MANWGVDSSFQLYPAGEQPSESDALGGDAAAP